MKILPRVALSLVVLVAFSNAAMAENMCKPKDANACQEAVECYWVKGYTNSKSEMIKGHCRVKPGNPKK